MELSHEVGIYLRPKSSWIFNLLVAFIIGTGVTMAEPAILALQAIGSILNVEETPYLYYVVNEFPTVLAMIIGVGVGAAVVIGFCKMRYGWQLRPLILMILLPTALLASLMSLDPDLQSMVGLAWDCGAITTGEVTVPVVVALGSGIAGTETDNPYAGLGIVTIGSLLPILTVQILSIFVWLVVPRDSITLKLPADHEAWYAQPGLHELKETLQITIPLILFLFFILLYVLKEKIPNVNLERVFEHDEDYHFRVSQLGGEEPSVLGKINWLWFALFLTIIGLYMFNVGLTKGLSTLGYNVGSAVPKLFITKENVWGPALFDFYTGVNILFFFVFLLGYGATVAEPALEILGGEVEILSKGKFSKRLLVHSISLGVGIGVVVGLVRIIFHIQVIFFILPFYWLAIFLTFFSTEAILHVAWDAAAVTTGPVTVPLILGIGIAVATEVRAEEGFGILALASLFPIITTLISGLLIQIPLVEKYLSKSSVTDPEADMELDDLLNDQIPGGYGAVDDSPLSLSSSSGRVRRYRGLGNPYVVS